MKNVFIVGVKNKTSEHIAKILAKQLNLSFFNAEQHFSEQLVLFPDFPLELADSKMKKFEKEFLENLTEREGVIYISNDMFLSNKNYKILASSVKVNALDYELNEIEQGIQNLLTKYCDLTVENNQDSIENLIKKLKM